MKDLLYLKDEQIKEFIEKILLDTEKRFLMQKKSWIITQLELRIKKVIFHISSQGNYYF